MKLRLLLPTAFLALALAATGCQNISNDIHKASVQEVRQNVHIGMSRDAVISTYGPEIFLQARTVADDEEVLVYAFVDVDADMAHNMIPIVSSINLLFGTTRKHLLILFDQQNLVKDFKLTGFYALEAVGYYSYRAYRHPLTEEQLALPRGLTREEGKESYYRYLTEVKGKDPKDFTEYDLAGNRESLVEYAIYVKEDAEAFAGPLKNVVVNDENFYDPGSQLQ